MPDAFDALGGIARRGGAAQPPQFFNQAGKVADVAAESIPAGETQVFPVGIF